MLLPRILVLLGALLAVLSLLAGYIRFQGLDTDTVEETAGDLIADPEIRDQVAATLVEQLFGSVDLQAALEEQLPPEQQGLSGPITAGIQLGADNAAKRLLERPRPQALWVASITESHRNLLRVLEDDTGPVTSEEGEVVLDLQPLLIQLGDRVAVVGRLNERILANPEAGRITIMEASKLETAQDVTRILKFLGTWLWVLPIGLWAGALWLARGRRRDILRMIGFASILAGFLVLVIRRVAGSVVVDELATTEALALAAGDAWDILTSLLRDGGLTLVGLGVLLLVAVWIAGPSALAVDARRHLAPHIARPEIAFGAAAFLLGALVWWGPTVQTQRWQLVVTGAVVLGIGVEILRRQTAREFGNPPTKGAALVRAGQD